MSNVNLYNVITEGTLKEQVKKSNWTITNLEDNYRGRSVSYLKEMVWTPVDTVKTLYNLVCDITALAVSILRVIGNVRDGDCWKELPYRVTNIVVDAVKVAVTPLSLIFPHLRVALDAGRLVPPEKPPVAEGNKDGTESAVDVASPVVADGEAA